MEGERVFKKHDVIFSETIGVSSVDEVMNLSAKDGNSAQYYCIRSVFDKGNYSYIPQSGHQMKLRELITPAEAMEKGKNMDCLSALEKKEVEYVLASVKKDTSKENA